MYSAYCYRILSHGVYLDVHVHDVTFMKEGQPFHGLCHHGHHCALALALLALDVAKELTARGATKHQHATVIRQANLSEPWFADLSTMHNKKKITICLSS